MNFEELVETRDVRKSNKVKMPFGYFHKRQIDGKYSNFVEFLDELSRYGKDWQQASVALHSQF